MIDRLRKWARGVKRDALALYLAARDPKTHWPVKALALIVVGYAFSPIDLIPDFIPVLGLVDDLLILPAGIWLVIRLIPGPIMAEYRASAEGLLERPVSRLAAAVIVFIWLASAGFVAWLVLVNSSREA